MCLCGNVLYIQIKKWYVKFGATGSLTPKVISGQRYQGSKMLPQWLNPVHTFTYHFQLWFGPLHILRSGYSG